MSDHDEDRKNKITRRIYIKQLKINLTLRDYPRVVHDFETRLSKLATHSRLDLHDMALELLLAGIESKEKERTEIAELYSQPDLDDDHKRLIHLYEKQEEIAKRNKLHDDLLPIFKDLGAEAFEEWCNETSYDAEVFYQLHSRSFQLLGWSKCAKEWIKLEMARATEPISISEVKKRAKADNILEEDESNWDALKKHAQRLNVSNKPYGYWFQE